MDQNKNITKSDVMYKLLAEKIELYYDKFSTIMNMADLSMIKSEGVYYNFFLLTLLPIKLTPNYGSAFMGLADKDIERQPRMRTKDIYILFQRLTQESILSIISLLPCRQNVIDQIMDSIEGNDYDGFKIALSDIEIPDSFYLICNVLKSHYKVIESGFDELLSILDKVINMDENIEHYTLPLELHMENVNYRKLGASFYPSMISFMSNQKYCHLPEFLFACSYFIVSSSQDYIDHGGGNYKLLNVIYEKILKTVFASDFISLLEVLVDKDDGQYVFEKLMNAAGSDIFVQNEDKYEINQKYKSMTEDADDEFETSDYNVNLITLFHYCFEYEECSEVFVQKYGHMDINELKKITEKDLDEFELAVKDRIENSTKESPEAESSMENSPSTTVENDEEENNGSEIPCNNVSDDLEEIYFRCKVATEFLVKHHYIEEKDRQIVLKVFKSEISLVGNSKKIQLKHGISSTTGEEKAKGGYRELAFAIQYIKDPQIFTSKKWADMSLEADNFEGQTHKKLIDLLYRAKHNAIEKFRKDIKSIEDELQKES